MEPQPATAAFPRKPSCCYIADDDDGDDNDRPLVPTWFDRSLDDVEAGFSRDHRRPPPDLLFRRDSDGSPRRMGGLGSGCLCFGGRTTTTRGEDREPHFLDSCCLCKKPLRKNKDIFMYRGDTPFCSKDCRQEQIELDQRRERNMNLSSSVRAAMRNKGQQGRSTSPSESPDPRLHTDTVVVA